MWQGNKVKIINILEYNGALSYRFPGPCQMKTRFLCQVRKGDFHVVKADVTGFTFGEDDGFSVELRSAFSGLFFNLFLSGCVDRCEAALSPLKR
jgi:hypothetical protein